MRKVRPSAYAVSLEDETLFKACARAKGWSYSRFMREAGLRLAQEVVEETGKAALLSAPKELAASSG